MRSLLLVTVIFLVSCSAEHSERIGGGNQDCRGERCLQEGKIHGKPARKHYEQFKYVVELGGSWYLQSARQPIANSANEEWSLDLGLDVKNSTYRFRLVIWKKDNNGQWTHSYQFVEDDKWTIRNIFLYASDLAVLSPDASPTKQGVKLTFSKTFPIKDLAGQEFEVNYVKSIRPL